MKIPMLLAAVVAAAGLMIGCDGQNMHYASANKPIGGEMKPSKHGKPDKHVARAEKKGEYDTKAKKHDDDDEDEEDEKEHKEKKDKKDKKEVKNKKEDDEKKNAASTTSKPAKAKHHDDDDDEDEEDDD
jgi:hypothetical protein